MASCIRLGLHTYDKSILDVCANSFRVSAALSKFSSFSAASVNPKISKGRSRIIMSVITPNRSTVLIDKALNSILTWPQYLYTLLRIRHNRVVRYRLQFLLLSIEADNPTQGPILTVHLLYLTWDNANQKQLSKNLFIEKHWMHQGWKLGQSLDSVTYLTISFSLPVGQLHLWQLLSLKYLDLTHKLHTSTKSFLFWSITTTL